MMTEREFLLTHDCHNYEALVDRWKAVAGKAGLRMEVFAEGDEFPLFVVESPQTSSRSRGLYLSAGVHGDEPAATEGLIGWAERSGDFLAGYPVTIFPCLNPWGLVNNCRVDSGGRDLNRMFDDAGAAPVRQWQASLRGREYRAGLCLHEDYDARGAYVYELARNSEGLGELGLEASSKVIPRHPGGEIEGRAVENGILRPDREIEKVLKEIEGMPEAIALYLAHTDVSLTYETPSEYSLYNRVMAQEAFLEAVAARLRD